MLYEAKDLEDIAAMFDGTAAAEERNADQHTAAKHRATCRAAASAWRRAAEILRSTKITKGAA